jgi:hypothetical protein
MERVLWQFVSIEQRFGIFYGRFGMLSQENLATRSSAV